MGLDFKQRRHLWTLVWLLAFAAIAYSLFVGIAHAQELDPTMPILDPSDDWATLAIKLLVIALNLVLIPAAVQYFRAKGVAIDEKHTRHFQLTLSNAAAYVLSFPPDQRRQAALTYVRHRAEDAVKHMKASDNDIWVGVEAWLTKLTLPAAGGSSGPTPNL